MNSEPTINISFDRLTWKPTVRFIVGSNEELNKLREILSEGIRARQEEQKTLIPSGLTAEDVMNAFNSAREEFFAARETAE